MKSLDDICIQIVSKRKELEVLSKDIERMVGKQLHIESEVEELLESIDRMVENK